MSATWSQVVYVRSEVHESDVRRLVERYEASEDYRTGATGSTEVEKWHDLEYTDKSLSDLVAAHRQDVRASLVFAILDAEAVSKAAFRVVDIENHCEDSEAEVNMSGAEEAEFDALAKLSRARDDAAASSEPQQMLCDPENLWIVLANLAIANLDFSDFQRGVAPDGVYHGEETSSERFLQKQREEKKELEERRPHTAMPRKQLCTKKYRRDHGHTTS